MWRFFFYHNISAVGSVSKNTKKKMSSPEAIKTHLQTDGKLCKEKKYLKKLRIWIKLPSTEAQKFTKNWLKIKKKK